MVHRSLGAPRAERDELKRHGLNLTPEARVVDKFTLSPLVPQFAVLAASVKQFLDELLVRLRLELTRETVDLCIDEPAVSLSGLPDSVAATLINERNCDRGDAPYSELRDLISGYARDGSTVQ